MRVVAHARFDSVSRSMFAADSPRRSTGGFHAASEDLERGRSDEIELRPQRVARMPLRSTGRHVAATAGASLPSTRAESDVQGHTGRDAYQDESSGRCHLAGPSRRSFPSTNQRQFHALRLHRLRSDARGRIVLRAQEERLQRRGRVARDEAGAGGVRPPRKGARRRPIRSSRTRLPGLRAIASGGLSLGVGPACRSPRGDLNDRVL